MLNHRLKIKIILAVFVYLQSSLISAKTMVTTEQNLRQIQHKIAILEQGLLQTHSQQSQIQQDLRTNKVLIKRYQRSIQAIQHHIQLKHIEIKKIEQNIIQSQLLCDRLQKRLVKQIQTVYKQPPNQALTWLLVPPHNREMGKIVTYHHYILRTYHHSLNQLQRTQTKVAQQKTELQHEIETLHKLQTNAQLAEKQLTTYQIHHENILKSLQAKLMNQESTLSDYQRNRDNLSQILRKLNQDSVIQTRQSMTGMKRKLPNPVAVQVSKIYKIHQGIMLPTAEGSVVQAVYPGKIVFGEWLNGYGLLVIIDHGWGLMTLYANNHSLSKHIGDIVNQGEPIATVGHGGISQEPGLYFEVRKYGKAISPLQWLSSYQRQPISPQSKPTI